MTSIPISDIVNGIPGVISAGGTGLIMQGLFLTPSTRIPYGSVMTFTSAAAVTLYFGAGSNESAAATTYFGSYTNSLQIPASMLFAGYATTALAGWLRGGALALTLTQLQALSGTLTIDFAGSSLTSATINLTGATSFSNAAALILAGFTSPAFTVTYDSVSGAFLFTSTATGAAETIIFATGTLAASLNLTASTGATLSQGVIADVPATAMAAIINQTTNWAGFTHLFTASDAQLVAFAAWVSTTNNRYAFVGWTNDVSAYSNPDTSSPAYLIKQVNYGGTMLIWAASFDKAAFILGYEASLNYTQRNGRTVPAFRNGAGLTADVTVQSIADQLTTNGYSFYGSYAGNNEQFTFFYNGQISGNFLWFDSYMNQIWLNANLQADWMLYLTAVGQVPYNLEGYEGLQAAVLGDITNALNFGAIRTGVTLSSSEAIAAAALAGSDISQTLFNLGYYLSVTDPGATVRAARGSPNILLIYTDGQSVQKITFSSFMVQ